MTAKFVEDLEEEVAAVAVPALTENYEVHAAGAAAHMWAAAAKHLVQLPAHCALGAQQQKQQQQQLP
eukprot:4731861-Prorocentrum_lima.AAC.1